MLSAHARPHCQTWENLGFSANYTSYEAVLVSSIEWHLWFWITCLPVNVKMACQFKKQQHLVQNENKDGVRSARGMQNSSLPHAHIASASVLESMGALGKRNCRNFNNRQFTIIVARAHYIKQTPYVPVKAGPKDYCGCLILIRLLSFCYIEITCDFFKLSCTQMSLWSLSLQL